MMTRLLLLCGLAVQRDVWPDDIVSQWFSRQLCAYPAAHRPKKIRSAGQRTRCGGTGVRSEDDTVAGSSALWVSQLTTASGRSSDYDLLQARRLQHRSQWK